MTKHALKLVFSEDAQISLILSVFVISVGQEPIAQSTVVVITTQLVKMDLALVMIVKITPKVLAVRNASLEVMEMLQQLVAFLVTVTVMVMRKLVNAIQ